MSELYPISANVTCNEKKFCISLLGDHLCINFGVFDPHQKRVGHCKYPEDICSLKIIQNL